MLFSSPEFLLYFLPAVLLAYHALPRSFRNLALVVASLLFYVVGEPSLWWLVLAYLTFNYVCAILIDRRVGSRALVAVGIAANVGGLVYFKYAGFLLGNVSPVLGWLGIGRVYTDIALPAGISFYTFHCISYIVDVYRGDKKAERSVVALALYLLFFPQLIAGPIVRFKEIADQIHERVSTMALFQEGVAQFVVGLAKKLVIADTAGRIADRIFLGHSVGLDQGPALTMGVIAYAVQIYFDFSGYSEMAAGMAQMFGLRFPQNFRTPYSALTMTDFWRRWHISLSSWFRDYVYIPLGGNRTSPARHYANLVFVFLLCGFWHGASWNFIVWGAWHGGFLVAERLRWGRWISALPAGLQRTYAMTVVLVGWVFFRSDSLSMAVTYLHGCVNWDWQAVTRVPLMLSLEEALLLGGAALWTFGPIRMQRAIGVRIAPVRAMACAALYVVSLVYAASSTHSSFIYFRF